MANPAPVNGDVSPGTYRSADCGDVFSVQAVRPFRLVLNAPVRMDGKASAEPTA